MTDAPKDPDTTPSTPEHGGTSAKAHRDEHGRFLPGGPSANPNGRPRTGLALSEAIRRKVNPDELVDIALAIARGKVPVPLDARDGGEGAVTWNPIVVKPKERIAALNFLADRGYIKPPQQLELTGQNTPNPIDFGKLSPEQLEVMDRLLAIAADPESTGGG